jgi:hypothetical protein
MDEARGNSWSNCAVLYSSVLRLVELRPKRTARLVCATAEWTTKRPLMPSEEAPGLGRLVGVKGARRCVTDVT